MEYPVYNSKSLCLNTLFLFLRYLHIVISSTKKFHIRFRENVITIYIITKFLVDVRLSDEAQCVSLKRYNESKGVNIECVSE